MAAEIDLPDEDLVTDEDLLTALALKADKSDARLVDNRTPIDGSVNLAKLATGFQLPRSKLDGSTRGSLDKADAAPQVDPETGLLPASIVPIQSLISWVKVADEAAMLASDTTAGSGVIREDTGTGWVLTENGDPAVLADWAELSAEASVISVNSRTGNVTGLAESSDARFTDERVPVDGSVDDSKIATGGLQLGSLSAGVQTALSAALTAYQAPEDGIPQADLDSATSNKVNVGFAGAGLFAGTVNLGDVSGLTLLNLSLGSVFKCRVIGSTVFQFVNWPTGTTTTVPEVEAQQDSVGHSISFSGITWLPDGSPPAFLVGGNQVNITEFRSSDNGTTIYGQAGSASGGGFGFYGDGSDGAITLDGTSTYPFLDKSGAFYTMIRDIYATNLTLAAGASLRPGVGKSFRIVVQNTLSIATGAFVSSAIGLQASASTGGSNLAGGSFAPGVDGPNGSTGVGVDGASVAGQSGGFGGRGGNGTGLNLGGAPGLATLPTGETLPRALPNAFTLARFGYQVPGSLLWWQGGAAGGSGGGDGTNPGGGGGCGGMIVHITARSIINNGTIQSIGGNGGTVTVGNVGGGAAGQGGPIVLIRSSYSGSGLVRSLGGTGGLGHGTGTNGASGGPGWVIQLTN
jgi:hypothetical protein